MIFLTFCTKYERQNVNNLTYYCTLRLSMESRLSLPNLFWSRIWFPSLLPWQTWRWDPCVSCSPRDARSSGESCLSLWRWHTGSRTALSSFGNAFWEWWERWRCLSQLISKWTLYWCVQWVKLAQDRWSNWEWSGGFIRMKLFKIANVDC